MKTHEAIIHNGVVSHIYAAGNRLQIKIADRDQHNCSGCMAASLCKGKGEIIDVSVPDTSAYSIGQQIRVAATSQTHKMSVALMLLLPLLAFILPLIILLSIGAAEWLALMSGLAGATAVYVVLYLIRKRLNLRFTFHII